ncbi:MAG: hypothetical protein COA78_06095 [Blastopirellula sp.]|nr:MAG: hypothetical protein COA78_06095 [Blastopirellula sp.]
MKLPMISQSNKLSPKTGTISLNKNLFRSKDIQDSETIPFSHCKFPLEAHPNIVLPETKEFKEDGYLTYSWEEKNTHSTSSMILKRKTIRLPLLFSRSLSVRIQGARVVGNQVLGIHQDFNPADFRNRVAYLLQQDLLPCDALLMEALSTQSPLYSSLIANQKTSDFDVIKLGSFQTHHKIKTCKTSSDYWSKFSSKTRYNFRRMCKRLTHDMHCIEATNEVGTFLHTAYNISQRSWQIKKIGPRISVDKATISYFQSIAKLGALRCYQLNHLGRPIAFMIGTQWQGVFQLEEVGYDQSYAQYSPGTVLLIRSLNDMFERNCPETIDFGFGDAKYKQLFGNDRSKSVNLLAVSNKFWIRQATHLHKMSSKMNSCLRDLLRVTGLSNKLRQLYRS